MSKSCHAFPTEYRTKIKGLELNYHKEIFHPRDESFQEHKAHQIGYKLRDLCVAKMRCHVFRCIIKEFVPTRKLQERIGVTKRGCWTHNQGSAGIQDTRCLTFDGHGRYRRELVRVGIILRGQSSVCRVSSSMSEKWTRLRYPSTTIIKPPHRPKIFCFSRPSSLSG